MAINYNSSPDYAQTLSQVNALSPKPDYNTNNITNAGSSPLFSMSPTTTGADFDSAYGTATAGYAPNPADHSMIDQYENLYKSVPSAFDVSGTVASLDKARSTSMLAGTQAANSAANKFQQDNTSQYAGAGASVLRAQSLLPFLQQDTAAAGDEGKYQDTAKQGALTTAAGIANNLATLQQQYTDSLATYNSQKAQFGLNYANDKTGLQLQSSTSQTQTALQAQSLAEQAREANLSAALNVRNANLSASQTATNQQMQAATSYLANTKAPTGAWETNNAGQITSGQSSYDAYQAYLRSKGAAMGALGNIAY